MTRKEKYLELLRINKKELVILVKNHNLATRRLERALKQKYILQEKLQCLK